MMRRRWVDFVLVAGVLALFAVALLLGSSRGQAGTEAFGGIDAAVTEELEASGYEPWFAPLYSPDSGEVESGLFAVQAALGAGLLGYCLGVMRRRSRGRGGAGDRPVRILVADVVPGGTAPGGRDTAGADKPATGR